MISARCASRLRRATSSFTNNFGLLAYISRCFFVAVAHTPFS